MRNLTNTGIEVIVNNLSGGSAIEVLNNSINVDINKQPITSTTASNDQYLLQDANGNLKKILYSDLIGSSGSGLTAGYSYAVLGYDGSGNARSANSNSTAYISFTSNAMMAGDSTHNLSFFITDPLNAIGTHWKVAYGQYGGWTDQASNSALVGTFSGGYYSNTNALSGFQIGTSNSATFETGNITLYGVKTT